MMLGIWEIWNLLPTCIYSSSSDHEMVDFLDYVNIPLTLLSRDLHSTSRAFTVNFSSYNCYYFFTIVAESIHMSFTPLLFLPNCCPNMSNKLFKLEQKYMKSKEPANGVGLPYPMSWLSLWGFLIQMQNGRGTCLFKLRDMVLSPLQVTCSESGAWTVDVVNVQTLQCAGICAWSHSRNCYSLLPSSKHI